MTVEPCDVPAFVTRWVNLAQPRLGAEAVFATDEFFAPKERLLKPEPPVFIPGKFDDHGKWMDGWESRRKRSEGYDYCIVKLGLPGIVHGVDIDTTHFTGNYPLAVSVDACSVDGEPGEGTEWVELVPATNANGDSHHFIAVHCPTACTHLRLNIFPDGGVARFRVYGQFEIDWQNRDRSEHVDLAAMLNGGRVVCCNDSHFGAAENIIAPGRGENMGDGWETRRRREPGNDWAIVALGHPGTIESVEVDTAHFKGNFPDRCSLQGAYVESGTDESLVTRSMFWKTLLPETPLEMDRQHFFETEIEDIGAVTHVRLNIFPDGGVSRLRLFGRLA